MERSRGAAGADAVVVVGADAVTVADASAVVGVGVVAVAVVGVFVVAGADAVADDVVAWGGGVGAGGFVVALADANAVGDSMTASVLWIGVALPRSWPLSRSWLSWMRARSGMWSSLSWSRGLTLTRLWASWSWSVSVSLSRARSGTRALSERRKTP